MFFVHDTYCFKSKLFVEKVCTASSEKKLLSCEKVLPVCAWLVFSKTGLFSAQVCRGGETHVFICMLYACLLNLSNIPPLLELKGWLLMSASLTKTVAECRTSQRLQRKLPF